MFIRFCLLLSYFHAANKDSQSQSQLSLVSSKCDKANAGLCQQSSNDSEVKRMIKMIEQQTSSGLQGNIFIYLRLVINPNPFFMRYLVNIQLVGILFQLRKFKNLLV